MTRQEKLNDLAFRGYEAGSLWHQWLFSDDEMMFSEWVATYHPEELEGLE